MSDRQTIDQIIRQRIETEINRLENLSDHDKLGVPTSAKQPEIVRAFVARQRDLDPALFANYEGQTHQLANDLYLTICEAAARLGVAGARPPKSGPSSPPAELKAPTPEAKPNPKPARVAAKPAPAAPAPAMGTPPPMMGGLPQVPMPGRPPMGGPPVMPSAPMPQGQPPMPSAPLGLPQVPQPSGFVAPAAPLPSLLYGQSGNYPQEGMWQQRAEVAERRLTELQYQGFQLLEQMNEVGRRRDAAEMLVQQLKSRLQQAEALNADLMRRLTGAKADFENMQAQLQQEDRRKEAQANDQWVRGQVGRVAAMLSDDADKSDEAVERHKLHLAALEDLAAGKTQRAAEAFRSLVELAPNVEAYRAGLQLAERTESDEGGFDDETTSGFRAALLMRDQVKR